MEYVQEITLDLNSNTAYTTIGAKQGDNNSRIVKTHITQDGEDYNLRENGVSSTYFRFRKPDGKAVINTCNIDYDNNIILLTLTSQTLAVAGRGYADITLMSGSSILSTVSFIIIIMSSPQIADQATSSSEFGYLNAVVQDATHTIYEAEAWATGTRGGEEVFGEDSLIPTKESEVITIVSLDNNGEDFKSKVGSMPGLSRVFSFTYTADGNWRLITKTTEGSTMIESSPEIISNLNDYGITIGLIGGVDSPNVNDKIIITLQEHDNTYHNNAKYYSELADTNRQAIENLTVTAETTLPVDHGGQAEVEKTINQITGIVNLNFKIPKGDTGDVNFVTLNINPVTGMLELNKPDTIYPNVNFYLGRPEQEEIEENLYFEIINGG